MTGYDPATLEFYAREAPVYTASGPNGASRHLPAFLDKLPPGARILELGCGGGRDALYMLEKGFELEATDGTAEIAKHAEKLLGKPVHVMRFDELDAEAEFDAVVASASLLHVPLPDLPAILARIYNALRPGGWHIASYKGGGKAGRDGFGRYFNYPDAERLRELYSKAGLWKECDIWSGQGGGYDGKQGPWHAVTVQKPT